MWKCIYLPWHKLKIRKIYTNLGGKQIECTCGKLYATHDELRTILPWDSEFELLYKDEPFTKGYK